MIPSDQRPPGQDWLVRRVTDLERQVRELQAGRRLEAATIGAGGMTITGGGRVTIRDGGGVEILDGGDLSTQGGSLRLKRQDGTEQVHIGPIFYGGEEAGIGWIFRRFNGSQVFTLEGTNPDNQFIAVRDEAGNIIFSDDATAGQGLATPYIPGGTFESMSVPTDATSGTTFVGVQKAIWRKQHPRIRFWTLWNVTSTTAEIQWKIVTGPDAGTVIGGPTTIGTGFSFGGQGPFTVPGAHLSEFEIDVEIRVASGAGSVAVRTLHAIGMQSP